MKKILFIITLFLSSFSFLPSFAQNSEGGVEGLHTDKTSEFKDGVGTITLDTFVEGEVKVVQGNPAPCDIVMVLDFSESMKSYLGSLKESCIQFLDIIRANNKDVEESKQSRVSIVSYSTDNSITLMQSFSNCSIVWPQKYITANNLDGLDAFGDRLSGNNNPHKPNNNQEISDFVRNTDNQSKNGFFIPINAECKVNNEDVNILDYIVEHFVETDLGIADTSHPQWGQDGNSLSGMNLAYDLLWGVPKRRPQRTYDTETEKGVQQRPTFVILFTDDAPGFESNSNTIDFSDINYSLFYAVNSIAVSNKLKKEGTEVFTVALNTLCDHTSTNKVDLKGVGTSMKPAVAFTNGTDGLNCYLHLLSSNYVGSDVDGITKNNWENLGNESQIKTFYDKRICGIWNSNAGVITKGNHYMEAGDGAGLVDAFKNISSTIVTTIVPVDLGTETVLKDFIDNSTFKLPDGVTVGDIEVYARKFIQMNGDTYEFSDPIYPNDQHVLTLDGKSYNISVKIDNVDDEKVKDSEGNHGVAISGFDYSENWVGFDQNSKPHGYELEVRIPFTFQEGVDVVDGTYQTNTPESGIYDGDGEIVQQYPVPEIQIWDLIITRNDLELGESVVYDVFTANSSTDYSQTKPIYRIVLTGTSVDGSEPVSETITGVIAYQNEKYLYYRVEETGWSWAYALQREQPQIKTYLDNHLIFEFKGKHDDPDSAKDMNPLNKLLHTEVVNKNGSLEYPTN